MKDRAKLVVFSIFFLLLFLPLLYFQNVEAQGWVIDGDKVYINNSWVYLVAEPHTIYSSGYVKFNTTSKVYEGDIDVVWGFNTSLVKPKKAELYKPRWVNVTRSYTCNPPYWYNYTTNPKHFWCWYNASRYDNTTGENFTETVLMYEHDFETYDLSTNTTYWNETFYKEWKDFSNSFNFLSYSYGGMDRWYYIKNVPIQANVSYYVRGWVEATPSLGSDGGKYWFCVKPSSLSLADAIAQGKFYCLDPWWNTSWQYRRNITINNTENANTLVEYQVPINISYDSNMQSDFSDLRFTWFNSTDSTETEIPYWIENKSDSEWAYTWVKVKEIPASSYATIYVYYGNTTPVSSISDSENTMILFENFSDCSFDTAKYYSGSTDIITYNNNCYLNLTADGDKFVTFNIGDKKFYWIYAIWVQNGTSATWGERFGTNPRYNLTKAQGYAVEDYNNNVDDRLRISDEYTGETFINSTSPADTPDIVLGNTYQVDFALRKYNTTHTYYKAYFDDVLKMEGSNLKTPTVPTEYIRFTTWDSGNVVFLKEVFARKYTEPEPSYSIGAEETPAAYFNLIFENYTAIEFGSVSHNSFDNPSAMNGLYKITVNSTCTGYIEFSIITLTNNTDTLTNVTMNYAVNSESYTEPRQTLPFNVTSLNDTDYVRSWYWLSVPYGQKAGFYEGNQTITGSCS